MERLRLAKYQDEVVVGVVSEEEVDRLPDWRAARGRVTPWWVADFGLESDIARVEDLLGRRVFEIVNVLDRQSLLDAESFQRKYTAIGAAGYRPGFYVVSWPAAAGSSYDTRAHFQGPFESRSAARAALRQRLQHVGQ